MEIIIKDIRTEKETKVQYNSNCILLVDPYLVKLEDLINFREGGIVPLRRPGWGNIDALHNAIKIIPLNGYDPNYHNDLC